MEKNVTQATVDGGTPYQLMRITQVDGKNVDYVGFFTHRGNFLKGFAYQAVMSKQDVEEMDNDAKELRIIKKDCPVLSAVCGDKRGIEFDTNKIQFEPIGSLYYIMMRSSGNFPLYLHGRSLAIPLYLRNDEDSEWGMKQVVGLRPHVENGVPTIAVHYQHAPELEEAA